MSQSVMWKKNCLLSSRSRSQQELIWLKYDSFTVSSKLLISWQSNLIWWYIIISQCLVKKGDNCIQDQGHNEGSKCHCLSRWYLLNSQTLQYQTWYCDASSCAEVHAIDWFALSMVKVTARAHVIKLWEFLLYLLNHLLHYLVHYHEPDCLMEKLDCSVEGQGHSKISEC